MVCILTILLAVHIRYCHVHVLAQYSKLTAAIPVTHSNHVCTPA